MAISNINAQNRISFLSNSKINKDNTKTGESTSKAVAKQTQDSYTMSAEARAALEKSKETGKTEGTDSTDQKVEVGEKEFVNNSSFSDEVYKKVLELAKRDAKAGNYQGGNDNNDFHDLMRPEVMKRGPDRTGLKSAFMPTLNSIFGNGNKGKDIIKAMMSWNGFTASMHGANRYQGTPPWMSISDKNGEECMRYLQGEWSVIFTTPEEEARCEMFDIYADAFDKERAKMYVEGTPYEDGSPVHTPQPEYLAEALKNQRESQ